MEQNPRKLKKHLTNPLCLQVLEIVGLAEKPLSANEIFQKSKKNNPSISKYVYEVIKELYRVDHLGKPHPERFLKLSYDENTKQKIKNIEATEKDQWIRPIKIAQITNNPRTWRYSLNLKGFLLYLFTVYKNDKINYKIINSVLKNLCTYPEFDFLQYLDIFGKEKVDLLIEIAVELQFNLMTYSREYLRYYIIKRCQEEISFWVAIEDNTLTKKFSRLMKKKEIQNLNELIKELSNYKIKILYELIPIEQNNLEFMMIDLNRTKQRQISLENPNL